MKSPCYITTSWDDGHVLDFRIADLLAKYNLRGTFYIPREASTIVMPEARVRELSQQFEIGAHTMHHVFLDRATAGLARTEIRDSKAWVEQVAGQPCAMFCPPGGKFDSSHVQLVRETGFSGLRTVELLSLAYPRRREETWILPTTLQAHPHGARTYLRNTIKRSALGNLWLYILHGGASTWDQLARSLVQCARQRGGVFHLWGHSWELEENAQWQRLDEVLSFLGKQSDFQMVTNGELVQRCIQS